MKWQVTQEKVEALIKAWAYFGKHPERIATIKRAGWYRGAKEQRGIWAVIHSVRDNRYYVCGGIQTSGAALALTRWTNALNEEFFCIGECLQWVQEHKDVIDEEDNA